MFSVRSVWFGFLLCGLCAGGWSSAANAADTTTAPSRFRSADDGWLDVSDFLDETYGFLPVVIPITEPAVGYGAAAALAFISNPLGKSREGFGRPSITAVGGLGTENGTRGAMAGDLRYWLDDRLQTLLAVVHSSVNLDFYGIGADSGLIGRPLSYQLETRGGMLQAKHRLGESRLWAGVNYAFAATQVSFNAPTGVPGRPDFQKDSNVGGLIPSLTFDSRDNIFTPIQGTYAELQAGLFSQALGGDDAFQRLRLVAMQFIPLQPRLYLGIRGDITASFGAVPFYLRPFVNLRGAPIMRYQGEAVAQIEAELRWQFWKRFSLVGFAGGGATWNDHERFENTQTLVTGGTGLRYEIARRYGIHMGLDVAFGPDDTAVYVQVGSAWARP